MTEAITSNQQLAATLRILASGYSTEFGRDAILSAAQIVENTLDETKLTQFGPTFESLVQTRLKEAREIYGPSAKNVTYLSRVSAQHVRDFIQRLADLLEAQRAQTRAGIRNAAPDEGPPPEPDIGDRASLKSDPECTGIVEHISVPYSGWVTVKWDKPDPDELTSLSVRDLVFCLPVEPSDSESK
jgi:hypothetical protein